MGDWRKTSDAMFTIQLLYLLYVYRKVFSIKHYEKKKSRHILPLSSMVSGAIQIFYCICDFVILLRKSYSWMPVFKCYLSTWKSGPCWIGRPSWYQATSGSGCPDTTTSNTAWPPSGTSSPWIGFRNRGGSIALVSSRPCCVDDAKTISK